MMYGDIWWPYEGYFGQIIFNLLLKAVNDPKILFEMIKENALMKLNMRGKFFA